MSIFGDIFGLGAQQSAYMNPLMMGEQQRQMMAAQQMQATQWNSCETPEQRTKRENAELSKMMAMEMTHGLMREFTRHQFPEFPIIPNQIATPLSPEQP